MKWLRWDKGRQGTGYGKMLLATSRLLRFDCYLLRIPDGVGVPEHTDPAVPGYEHHRLNVFLKRPCIGTGVVSIEGQHRRWLGGRVHLFRPDLYPHSMTPVETMWSDEHAYILSIGWLRRAGSTKEQQ